MSRGYVLSKTMPNGKYECVVSKAGGGVKTRNLRLLVLLDYLHDAGAFVLLFLPGRPALALSHSQNERRRCIVFRS